MIIVNKTNPPRPLIIPKPLPKTVTGIVENEPIILRPGANETADELQATFDSSKSLKEWVKRGWIDVIKAEKGKEKSSGVSGFESDQAVSIVNDCFDVSMLQHWREADKREAVRIAIVDRLSQLATSARD